MVTWNETWGVGKQKLHPLKKPIWQNEIKKEKLRTFNEMIIYRPTYTVSYKVHESWQALIQEGKPHQHKFSKILLPWKEKKTEQQNKETFWLCLRIEKTKQNTHTKTHTHTPTLTHTQNNNTNNISSPSGCETMKIYRKLSLRVVTPVSPQKLSSFDLLVICLWSFWILFYFASLFLFSCF